MSVNSIWQKSQDFPQNNACELHLSKKSNQTSTAPLFWALAPLL
jgi:hypothetical protein